ncbi:TPA: tail fiber domain-containing protein [Serratia marcescens]|uniref:tail fiber domain-containing protein n=1 Tax=Serratia marcescens TaxID=615 RepID=UPI0018D92F8A|nr:tail fiber domain-containing protein [Serratia marcescens]MBH3200467.1 tail fiber domain-containing protein [Serratia marcescens]HEJ6931171.1 tail fiber domain-containing protein [Serratia marcescens]HEJ7074081.1 tail fiber domain-containing protein [Serratia marcescens]HEJ7172975.1 tail fiber domain-containing protein [Serratia marcescens]HEJ7197483.1 tail fiber domain-containing protein [Serratia marcescens]
MPTGTLTLTNNSTIVKGTGTAFNTELKAGDFIVSVVGGVTYTLPAKTVDSATQATLIKAYDGPTQAGAAWYAVPRDAMNAITAQLATETAKALRGLNLDKENWQQVFSNTGNITVKLPDGGTYIGPAWNSITASLNNKLDKTVTTAQEIKGDLSLQGSLITGQAANLDVGGYARFRKSVTFDDYMLLKSAVQLSPAENSATSITATNTFTGNSGTVQGPAITSQIKAQGVVKQMTMSLRQELNITDYGFISFQDWAGRWHEVRLQNNGDMNNLTGNWVTGSDRRIKTEVEEIEDPITLIRGLKLYTGKRDGKPFIGGIAQEIEKSLPQVVAEGGSLELQNGEMVERVKSVDYSTLGYVALAALNQALDRIDRQDELIKELMEKVQ